MTKSKRPSEREIIAAYESGHLQSIKPTGSALKRFKESARGTFIKDRRVNIRLSSPDLMDIQARAAEEGVPYQTLMSSVLHKFVSGQFVAKAFAPRTNARTDSEATYDLNERRDSHPRVSSAAQIADEMFVRAAECESSSASRPAADYASEHRR